LIKRDPIELADKIKHLMNNPAKVTSIGSYSLKVVKKRWSWDSHAQAVEEALNSIKRK